MELCTVKIQARDVLAWTGTMPMAINLSFWGGGGEVVKRCTWKRVAGDFWGLS